MTLLDGRPGFGLQVFHGKMTHTLASKPRSAVFVKIHLPIWKESDAGKDCGKEEEGMTEDEMAERHLQLNGCEFE